MRADNVIKAEMLGDLGFIVGDRDPRLNMAFTGKFMVAEKYEDSQLPTDDAQYGPWCIVGDNLEELVETAFAHWYN